MSSATDRLSVRLSDGRDRDLGWFPTAANRLSNQTGTGTEIQRSRLWTLAVNRNQNLLGKCLVIANRPCGSIPELHAEEWSSLFEHLRQLTAALDAIFAPDAYNHAFLMNVDPQVHLHVIPRYANTRVWQGMQFHDPHWRCLFGTEQRLLPTEHLSRLSDAVRRALQPPT
jgi:diadenosine tetraphosphate (Ap4A) HIT family hydrolase